MEKRLRDGQWAMMVSLPAFMTDKDKIEQTVYDARAKVVHGIPKSCGHCSNCRIDTDMMADPMFDGQRVRLTARCSVEGMGRLCPDEYARMRDDMIDPIVGTRYTPGNETVWGKSPTTVVMDEQSYRYQYMLDPSNAIQPKVKVKSKDVPATTEEAW